LRPELIKVLNNVQSDWSAEIAFTYHILNTFAHVFHMRQRKVLSDNEWTGWLRLMKGAFEQGKIKEYWESNLEIEKWFDPAFEEFIKKELTPVAAKNNARLVNINGHVTRLLRSYSTNSISEYIGVSIKIWAKKIFQIIRLVLRAH
jgi:hypothetical protein